MRFNCMENRTVVADCRTKIYPIIHDIMDDVIPYSELKREVNSIILACFEDLDRSSEVIEEDADIGLIDTIKDKIEIVIDGLLSSEMIDELSGEVVVRCQGLVPIYGEHAIKETIFSLIEDIVNSQDLYLSVDSRREIKESELMEKYLEAKERTLWEYITQSNDDDVREYYEAMLNKTFYECRRLVAKKYQDFIVSLVDRVTFE